MSEVLIELNFFKIYLNNISDFKTDQLFVGVGTGCAERIDSNNYT